MANNHFTLMNGKVDNFSVQDEFHYGELGYNLDENGHTIPASAADPTLDALGNPLTVTQDGKSFLDTCKLEHYPMPRVVQADSGNIWFDADGTPRQLTMEDVKFGGWDNQYYSANKEEDRVTNIATYKKSLTGRQDITEMKVRDTEETFGPTRTTEDLYFDFNILDDAKIFRGNRWKLEGFTLYNGDITITKQDGSIYNLGEELLPGEYLVVTPSVDGTIAILNIIEYIMNNNEIMDENIFFETIDGDSAKIVKGYDWTIPVGGVTDYEGTSTIKTSSDNIYTLGGTVVAGDYLVITNDTVNARTVIQINKI